MRKNRSGVSTKKAQSAIEYLVTYGWVFLILALVLLVLFQLGIFNSNTFTVRAIPGSCHISRPNGPYTMTLMSLAGACQNSPPEYVAFFTPFVTQNSIVIGPKINEFISNSISIAAWFETPLSITPTRNVIATDNAIKLYAPTSVGTVRVVADLSSSNTVSVDYTGTFPTSRWTFIVGTYNGNVLSIYINGTLANTAVANLPLYMSTATGSNFSIGGQLSGSSLLAINPFAGSISNVQLYNSSLSSSEVEELYVEGIGGAPIVSPNLMGWWPLNGNVNDYSGNNNNANSVGVQYPSQWTAGYNIP
jgi:hypothetical protein